VAVVVENAEDQRGGVDLRVGPRKIDLVGAGNQGHGAFFFDQRGVVVV